MIEDEEEEIADTLDDDQGDKGHDSHNPVVKEQWPFPPWLVSERPPKVQALNTYMSVSLNCRKFGGLFSRKALRPSLLSSFP